MGLLTTLLELIGLALIVTGVAMLSVPAAFITAGVGFVAVGASLARDAQPPAPVDEPGIVT